MPVEKRKVADRDFWFTAEHVHREDDDTGEFIPTGRYYCAFAAREPGALIQGEVLKDDRGRARLFATPGEAIEAGVREVEARLSLPAKAYAVNLPTGATRAEYDACVDQLGQEGIRVDESSRVEDSFGRKWLHAWATREEAERFARRLRRATGNRDWEVYELNPLRDPAGGREGRPGPIEILIGRQGDGITYGLHPRSLKRIRALSPPVRPHPSIFIGDEHRPGDDTNTGAEYDRVALLLTGLTHERLMDLGGYRVLDPISDLVLYEADPAVR